MALGERRKERLQREDRRAGEVVAMLYNLKAAKRDDTIDWLDVFPEWKTEARQTEEQMYETMKMWSTVKQLPS